MPLTRTFDRRALLGAAGVGVLAAAGGSLTGCSQGQKSTNTVKENKRVTLPTYRAYEGVTPDLPGTKQGVLPAFRNIPKDRPRIGGDKPGNGQSVSAMANIYYAVPPGPERNPWWAGLNERLGVDLRMQMVPDADYATKFATTVAGNDLPDMLMLQLPNSAIPNLPQLLKARFTDLTEYLSGDGILDYPNLANIPSATWKAAVYNGGIYGIPVPRGAIGNYVYMRQDLFEKHGANTNPKSYDELVETTKALTDPKERRWCFSQLNQPYRLLGQMNGMPNNWREEGGRLTRSYETDEFKQTVTDLIAMWDSGVMHPDAFSPTQPFKALFSAGTVAVNADGYAGWTQYVLDNRANPEFKLGLMPSYERTSGQLAHWWLGNGFFSVNAFKKQDDPKKIKLLLRICDYLAAPFGTEEYFYRLYGQEGRDHTLDERGNPILTGEGKSNTVVPIRYLADAPPVVFEPGRPHDADVQHAYQTLEVPTGIADPTVGLFSNTFATKNGTIDKAFNDGLNDIIQGRKPFSALDGLISTWRKSGGDTIRAEYEDQMQKR